eukprot:Rmarinus@m.23100
MSPAGTVAAGLGGGGRKRGDAGGKASGVMAPARSFQSHQGGVTAVQWSPHRKTLFASGGRDNIVQVHDLALCGLGETAESDGAEISMDDGSVEDSYQAGCRFSPSTLLFRHAGHRNAVVDFRWNPHEAYTITSLSDDHAGGKMQIWRMSDMITRPAAEVERDIMERFPEILQDEFVATTKPPKRRGPSGAGSGVGARDGGGEGGGFSQDHSTQESVEITGVGGSGAGSSTSASGRNSGGSSGGGADLPKPADGGVGVGRLSAAATLSPSPPISVSGVSSSSPPAIAVVQAGHAILEDTSAAPSGRHAPTSGAGNGSSLESRPPRGHPDPLLTSGGVACSTKGDMDHGGNMDIDSVADAYTGLGPNKHGSSNGAESGGKSGGCGSTDVMSSGSVGRPDVRRGVTKRREGEKEGDGLGAAVPDSPTRRRTRGGDATNSDFAPRTTRSHRRGVDAENRSAAEETVHSRGDLSIKALQSPQKGSRSPGSSESECDLAWAL